MPLYLQPLPSGTVAFLASSRTNIPLRTLTRSALPMKKWLTSSSNISRWKNLASRKWRNPPTLRTSPRPLRVPARNAVPVLAASGTVTFGRRPRSPSHSIVPEDRFQQRCPPEPSLVAQCQFNTSSARRKSSFSFVRRRAAADHWRDILRAVQNKP